MLTRIVIWWSAFTSLTGLVSNFYLLLATRFAFGMGEAGAYPNASSSISRWFPLAERARAHGIVWTASRVGGALTPLLVVPIVAAWGWRAAFYLFGIIGVVWAIVWYWWYRDYPAEMPGVTADRVNVRHEPGVLVIRGERQLPVAGSRLAVRQLEIPYGAFERRISLPGVHLDAGVPELTQGLLVLRMRKTG